MTTPFNIVIVAQAGRLAFESLLFLASLRAADIAFSGRVFVAIPTKNDRWSRNPAVTDQAILDLYAGYGAEVIHFENNHFGQSYAHGNKIECLAALPKGEPFIFFDTDTLVLGPLSDLPFDFDKPSASMKRGPTWPEPELYHAGYAEIWGALYARFGLDFAASQDETRDPSDWQRYLYFNAGWFYGACPVAFGERFTQYAVEVRDHAPDELVAQSLDPWLDQVVLPLVIHSFGGGRPNPDIARLDDDVTCHWRALPLLYASRNDRTIAFLETIVQPNKLKKVLRTYEPFLQIIWKKQGLKAQSIFPEGIDGMSERIVRNRLKAADLWMR